MIIPVLLAGGSGARLWPIARNSFPKQFATFHGGKSLFCQAVARVSAPVFQDPLIVTNQDWRFIVSEQLEEAGMADADILLEPEARSTAPAILTAALYYEDQPDAVFFVAPSDQKILDVNRFHKMVKAGAEAAMRGEIVTFGVKPTRPDTDLGYLELSKAPKIGEPQCLRGFTEKPDAETAQALIQDGRHYWNSGMFMFRVDTILEAFESLMPQLLMPCRTALVCGAQDLNFFRLEPQAYGRCENISVDVAIMEACDALTMIPVDFDWSDLGTWRSVRDATQKDDAGNSLTGSALQIDCKNSLLCSDKSDKRIVGLGLDNIAAIATDDAILAANLDAGEQVKNVVDELKVQGAPQADSFRQCHRPWGHYETLALGKRFQVKQIVVKPGGKLSLQSHLHRSEHWVVVAGTATVTVGETRKMLAENQSVYIPLGEVHRLENEGKVPLTLIEVQSGSYLGEDDIIRYEDVYDRDTEEAQAA
ncbi:MAG: mannose-1-phosphate guanylyltransferase/mannose-6-phosphate isomerase [Marinovum sp.]|nr:mannose-1-phosphate guanylyltransferase/mannose-6-phosphate isomerase [Marinovum sp.]